MKKVKRGKRAAEKDPQRKKKMASKTAAKKAAAKQPAVKRRAVKTKAAPKNKTAPLTVDAYFAAVPEPARSAITQIRAAIRSVVPPEATEIIGYKIPAFKDKKVLVWYAAFANHCSLFPTAAVIDTFKNELKDFSTSKGTIHFPLDKPMPVELIKKMVQERLGRSG
jgi:uncharacterized protein YdhG (YjbR/CyaY superfamily)